MLICIFNMILFFFESLLNIAFALIFSISSPSLFFVQALRKKKNLHTTEKFGQIRKISFTLMFVDFRSKIVKAIELST